MSAVPVWPLSPIRSLLTASPSIGGVRSTFIQSRSKAVRLAQAKPPALAALRQALVPRRGQCQAHGEARHRSAVCAVVLVCTRQEAYAVKFFNQNARLCRGQTGFAKPARRFCLFVLGASRHIEKVIVRMSNDPRVRLPPNARRYSGYSRVLTGTHGYPRVRLPPNAKPGGT